MFGIISTLREHIRTEKELHDKAMAIQLRGLDTLIFVFQKTTDGETYYVNCTPEENRERVIFTQLRRFWKQLRQSKRWTAMYTTF